MALYYSVVVMKGFNSSRSLFFSRNYYCEAEGWPSFKCGAMHSPTHFYK